MDAAHSNSDNTIQHILNHISFHNTNTMKKQKKRTHAAPSNRVLGDG